MSEMFAPERHRGRLVCYFRRWVRSREDVLDLAQETLYRAYRYQDRWQGQCDLGRWLLVIAKSVRIWHYHKRTKREVNQVVWEGFDVPDAEADPARLFLREVDLARALWLVQNIPSVYAEALLLQYSEGLSKEQIAARLGVRERIISARLNRGMKALRELVNPAPKKPDRKPRGASVYNAALTTAQVEEFRRLAASGRTRKEVAEQAGVSVAAVYKAVSGKSYRDAAAEPVPHQQQRGSEHPAAKLRQEQADAIRERYAAGGASHSRLAREYGCSSALVRLIVTGKRYATDARPMV